MTLARKLTFALVLGIAVVMAGNAYVRITREVALFRTDQARDQRTMGRALRAAVTAIWQSDGEARARRLVEEADQNESEVQIRWVVDRPHKWRIAASWFT